MSDKIHFTQKFLDSESRTEPARESVPYTPAVKFEIACCVVVLLLVLAGGFYHFGIAGWE